MAAHTHITIVTDISPDEDFINAECGIFPKTANWLAHCTVCNWQKATVTEGFAVKQAKDHQFWATISEEIE